MFLRLATQFLFHSKLVCIDIFSALEPIPQLSIDACVPDAFDLTYPAGLYGIISEEEFHESINRINQAIVPSGWWTVLQFFYLFVSICGLALTITTAVISKQLGIPWYPPVGAGLLVNTSMMTCSAFTSYWTSLRVLSKMKIAIAAESEIYSSRLSNPCNWRVGEKDDGFERERSCGETKPCPGVSLFFKTNQRQN